MASNVSIFGSARRDPLYGPSAPSRESALASAIAQQALVTGTSTAPVQSPLEGLARALQAPLGAYIERKSIAKDEARASDRNALLARALAVGMGRPAERQMLPGTTPDGRPAPISESGGAPQSAGSGGGYIDWNAQPGNVALMSRLLMQNPDTAPLGAEVGMGQIDRQQALAAALAEIDARLAAKANEPYTLNPGDQRMQGGQVLAQLPPAPPSGFQHAEGGGVVPIPGYVEGRGALANALRGPETYGQPVAAIGPDGQPTFARFGSRGAVQPVQGYQPPPGDTGGLTVAQQRWNASIDQARQTLAAMGLTADEVRRMSQRATDTGRDNPEYNENIGRLVREATKRKNGDDPQQAAFFNRYMGGQDVPLPGAPGGAGGAGGQADPMLGEIGSMDIDELSELLDSGALSPDQVIAVDERLNQILSGGGGQGNLDLGGGTMGDRLTYGVGEYWRGAAKSPGHGKFAPGPSIRSRERHRMGQAHIDHIFARGNAAVGMPAQQRSAQEWQDIQAVLTQFNASDLGEEWEKAERELMRYQAGGR